MLMVKLKVVLTEKLDYKLEAKLVSGIAEISVNMLNSESI